MKKLGVVLETFAITGRGLIVIIPDAREVVSKQKSCSLRFVRTDGTTLDSPFGQPMFIDPANAYMRYLKSNELHAVLNGISKDAIPVGTEVYLLEDD